MLYRIVLRVRTPPYLYYIITIMVCIYDDNEYANGFLNSSNFRGELEKKKFRLKVSARDKYK